MSLNLIDRIYDPIFLMELNMEEKKYEAYDDKFVIIPDSSEPIDIDPKTNIIISAIDNNIRRNHDGSLCIFTHNDINLSGCRLLINSFAVLDLYVKLKISVPKGIIPNIDYGCSFINKIYSNIDIIPRKNENETIPQHLIYHTFSFTLYLDLDKYKRNNKTMVIKKGTTLLNIVFQPTYFIGSSNFPNIDMTYLFTDSEMYNQFIDIF